jgi:hypothetical protein
MPPFSFGKFLKFAPPIIKTLIVSFNITFVLQNQIAVDLIHGDLIL